HGVGGGMSRRGGRFSTRPPRPGKLQTCRHESPLPGGPMRWSIIRLIWLRELRDQLRDRRTVFLIAVLPVLVYPLAAFGFLLVAGPPGFQEALLRGGRPELVVLTRAADDTSRQANVRVTNILQRWQHDLKEVRLIRRGLAARFDEPFGINDPERSKPPSRLQE